MRHLFTLLSICLLSIMTYAQPIPNAYMESWEDFAIFEEPTGWATPNQFGSLFSIYTVFQSTDVHSGDYAARLETANVPLLGFFPGIITNGELDQVNLSIAGGTPYTDRPTKFTGWYKYAPLGGDSCEATVYLTRWDAVNNVRDTVGIASFVDTTTQTSYTRFEAFFDYASTQSPDTALIIVQSSRLSSGTAGSQMWVDDLRFAEDTTEAAFNVFDLCLGEPTQFTDLSAGDMNSWNWDFGDGNIAAGPNPMHTYINAGTYNVTLTASDGTAPFLFTQSITIETPPTADAGSDVTVCAGVPVQLSASGGDTYLWTPDTGLDDDEAANPNLTRNTAGDYEYVVQAISAAGCIGTDTLVATILEAPTIEAEPDTMVCPDNEVNLLATPGNGGLAATWSPGTNLNNPNVVNPVFSASTPGVYTYEATTQNGFGCQATATVVIEVEVCGSVEDELLSEALSVYPNPAADVLQMNMELDEISDVRIELMQLDGKLIWEGEWTQQLQISAEVEVTDLPAGLYVLKASTEQAQAVRKIWIQ